jgi:hypothetical protein
MDQNKLLRSATETLTAQVAKAHALEPIDLYYVRNPVQRGHRFQRKADSIPVIADSR